MSHAQTMSDTPRPHLGPIIGGEAVSREEVACLLRHRTPGANVRRAALLRRLHMLPGGAPDGHIADHPPSYRSPSTNHGEPS